jgi:6-phosphogluconate dehydrogenase
MGQNLARNLARHGIPVSVYNRTASRTDHFMREFAHEGAFTAAATPEELVASIARPRAILVMVKAGAPVDAAIDQLAPLLDRGDILIDGGNSFFLDTIRRDRKLAEQGLQFIGTGVSGGEEGALNGPSIMPGGSEAAYRHVEEMLSSIAAVAEGEPCCTYIGADGAGHYVKMVHNGIEYADIQLIAETYDLLRHSTGLEAPALADVFSTWNEGDLESYLIEITADVLRKRDATGAPLVDLILDQAEQKGTGKWTSQSALDLGVPLTAITEAVFARMLSAQKAERVRAAKVLPGPDAAPDGDDRSRLVDDVRDALYASKVIAYAQGFVQMHAAAAEYGWHLRPGAIASIWRGGCIIRARFLNRITDAYGDEPELTNLVLAPYFSDALARCQPAWRRVVRHAVAMGIPVPAFSSSLAYYDGYRRERLPANLIQGLRDYFGAHTYQRTDRDGSFHTRWAQDGSEVAADGAQAASEPLHR